MQQLPTLELDLDGRPGSVDGARRATRRFLDALADRAGTALHEETRDDVVLVVSELVSNACRHAPGPCRLMVAVTGHFVDVAVADTSPDLLEPAGIAEPAGYGLRVVTGLGWGLHVLPTAGGKIVHTTVPER